MRLDKILGREKLIRKYVEDECVVYFDRIDLVSSRFARCFCSQVVCSTIGDCYDFFYYLKSGNNLFYKNIGALDYINGCKMYKWFGMYHAICLNRKNNRLAKLLGNTLELVFNWNEDDKKIFDHFLSLQKRSDSLFDVAFMKHMTKDVLVREIASPVVLARLGNMFYNAHKTFMAGLRESRYFYINNMNVRARSM